MTDTEQMTKGTAQELSETPMPPQESEGILGSSTDNHTMFEIGDQVSTHFSNIGRHQYRCTLVNIEKITFSTSIMASLTTTLMSNDTNDYKLPHYIKPKAYDLTLYPNLENGTFKGTVIATVDVLEETELLKIHSHGLTITSVNIEGKPADFEVDKKYELLRIKHSKNGIIGAGKQSVTINYEGDMKNRIVGLYTSTYLTENNQRK
ncbi:hypothetical protein FQA39_LY06195 [Lamprigera yunnana]|nr:hypothetical protein FQA39_LY06195 [Lamprigera yunnana]